MITIHSDTVCDAQYSIAQLFKEYQRPLLSYLTHRIGDRMTAEDLCQETFLKAWCHWAQHDPTASATSWLYRIATNLAYNHLRRDRRISYTYLQEAQHLPNGRDRLEQLELGEPVRVALAQMAMQDREALLLQLCLGLSIQEIATRLDCSTDAAKMRLYRPRMRFRQLYQG